MKRYVAVTKPVAGDYWDRLDPKTSITVTEPDDPKPVNTKLLDQNGTPLWRMPDERRAIGFLARWKR